MVTSSAVSPTLGPIVLGYVHRSIDLPNDAVASFAGADLAVQVLELPLV